MLTVRSRPAFVAILGPTATGKSALGRGRWPSATSAARSSPAIRRRSIAASTSAPTRCRPTRSSGIPHHLVDIAEPTEVYTAARYARDAAAAIRDDPRPRPPADPRRRHRVLLSARSPAACFPGPAADAGASRPAGAGRGAARRRAPAPLAAARRPGVGGAHPAPRSQAPDPRARGLLPHGPAAHRAFRRHRGAACRSSTSIAVGVRLPADVLADRAGPPRRRAVRRRAGGRGARAARARRAARRRGPSAVSSIAR